MAGVFLSYDRRDAAAAGSIARALGKAGQKVWWDRHIKGGAQYSREIEAALKSADAVLVLWSEHSVESAWVRDEATSGRDRGRLVPMRLNGAEPPLGFRQYQDIDLGRWRGRGKPPQLRAILSSIAALAGEQSSPPLASPRLAAEAQRPRMIMLLAAAALAIAAIFAAYFVFQRQLRGDTHTIVVTAADPAARPLAQDLLANLGSLQSSQSGPLNLVGEPEAKAELVLEATKGPAAGQGGTGLILKSGRDRGILWSRDFDLTSAMQADLKQRMAFTAWRALDCAIEGLEAEGQPLDREAMKTYLNVCARYDEADDSELESIIPQFREVVAKAPRFKAGWAMLLLSQANFAASMIDMRAELDVLRGRLRKDIGEARKLDSGMIEATLAEAAVLPRNAHFERLRLLDAAKDRSPENHLALESRAKALMRVGRLRDAIEDSKRSAELAPWSPRARSGYVLTLAFAGRTDAAQAELKRAEELWTGTPVLRDAQYNFHWHFGDPLVALELTPPGLPRGREMFLQARADPSSANIDRFLNFIRAMYERMGRTDISPAIVQEFAAFNREDELYDRILDPRNRNVDKLSAIFFEPPLKTFRRDPRFMQAAKKAGLVDYWQKSGKWPDFCFEEEVPYDCKSEAARQTG